MICPRCEGEFREGIAVCPDCEVELVEEIAEPEHDLEPFETVYETGETAVLPVVRSLLEGSGIPFLIRNEEALGLFPAEGIGLMIDPRSHAAEVQVPVRHAEAARELLRDLPAVADGEGDRE
jgi:hypothetical protein